MVNRIINEVVDDYIRKNALVLEYKNPKDAETIRVCAELLEKLRENMITCGASKNEHVVVRLGRVISELDAIKRLIT